MSAIGPKLTWASAPHMSAFEDRAEWPAAGVRYSGRYRGQSGHAVLRCICLLL